MDIVWNTTLSENPQNRSAKSNTFSLNIAIISSIFSVYTWKQINVYKGETPNARVRPLYQIYFVYLLRSMVNQTTVQHLTLNTSFPLTLSSMSLDPRWHLTSLAEVPWGTLTSIKTSSMVWYQEPQGVLQGTTPLLSSKCTDMLQLVTGRLTKH